MTGTPMNNSVCHVYIVGVCVYTAGGLHAFYSLHSSLCSRPDEPPSRPFLYSPTTPVVELDVDSAQMSQILPFLYLGND